MTVEEITPQQLESEIVRSLDIALVDVRPAAEVRCWKIDTNGLPFINVPADVLRRGRPRSEGRCRDARARRREGAHHLQPWAFVPACG